MKGNNTLTLNPATMQEAVQFYLNNRVFMSGAAIEVASVSASDCSPAATFKVVVTEIKGEAKK